MAEQTEQDMRGSTIYDDLITSLINLKIILEDIDKANIAKDLEINNKLKELEAETIYELKLGIKTLRNRFLRKSNKIEEEIDLRRG